MILCPVCGSVPSDVDGSYRHLCRCERLTWADSPSEFIFRVNPELRSDFLELRDGELRKAPSSITYMELEDVPPIPRGDRESVIAEILRDALVTAVMSS